MDQEMKIRTAEEEDAHELLSIYASYIDGAGMQVPKGAVSKTPSLALPPK